MRAFLLAAGLGTRLRPLTDTVPKCMMPVDGKPMLYHWFRLLEKHSIDEVLINLHHLPGIVTEYVWRFSSSRPNLQIQLFYEQELAGSAGTVKANAQWIEDETDFLIAYADNLTNADLTRLIRFHRSKRPVLTMGLFHSDYPQGCGIAKMDDDGLIVDFVEKPQNPRSDMANAGIYVASPGLLNYIPDGFADLGHDVLPKLVGRMYGCEVKGFLRDIGTMENYSKAAAGWRQMGVSW
jgi:mannose-1-phosphate guanylyltransferase